MDTVIFSGRISKTEMLHERKRWYERLVGEQHLEEYRVKDKWREWRSTSTARSVTSFSGWGRSAGTDCLCNDLPAPFSRDKGRSRPAVVQPAGVEDQP